MALFFPDDKSYDESIRMTGFNRYRQLMSAFAFSWIKANIVTVIAAMPLAIGIIMSIISSSSLILIPLALAGGAIFGPFLAALYDLILRGMRDDYGDWWFNYRKGLRQNWKEALLPGAFTGLIAGMFIFMLYMLMSAKAGLKPSSIALYLISALLFLIISQNYWTQVVLFNLPLRQRLTNILLFSSKYMWRVAGGALIKLLLLAFLALLAPWTLILVPFLGLWYPIFVSEFMIYDKLNYEFQLEELIRSQKENSGDLH